MRKFILPLMFWITAVPGCGPTAVPSRPAATKAAPEPDLAFDELLGLMRSRLDVMHDVARWKWTAKSPVEDPKREAVLLDDVADRGKALGLEPADTRAFFRAQIEAAKVVQRADLHRWEAEHRGPDGEAPDLAKVLRPRIDGLNRDLLAALSRTLPRLQGDEAARKRLQSRADELLAGEGIDAEARTEAIRPLVSAPTTTKGNG